MMAPALAARPLAAAARRSQQSQHQQRRRLPRRARHARVVPSAALDADVLTAAVSAGGAVLDFALGGVGPAWGAAEGSSPFGLSTETLSYGLAALVSLGVPLAFASARQNRCALPPTRRRSNYRSG